MSGVSVLTEACTGFVCAVDPAGLCYFNTLEIRSIFTSLTYKLQGTLYVLLFFY